MDVIDMIEQLEERAHTQAEQEKSDQIISLLTDIKNLLTPEQKTE